MDDIERMMFEALSVEAAYDLCLDALGMLLEAGLVHPAYLLQSAIVAMLEPVREVSAAV